MSFKPSVVMGYSQNWYPKVEPVIPRVYHEYINDSAKENMYTMEELGADKAYFVSKPDTYKVFTYGGARVELICEGPEKAELLPGTMTENNIEKRVSVKNIGEKDAYVRVHIAIPKILDDNVPTFNAMYNMLHFNTKKEELATGKWNFSTSMDRPNQNYAASGKWNFYVENIDGEEYAVYVGTYETPLKTDEIAVDAIYQAYLDAKAVADDLVQVYKVLNSNEWEIKVAVEAVAVTEEDTDCLAAFDKVSPVGKKYVF